LLEFTFNIRCPETEHHLLFSRTNESDIVNRQSGVAGIRIHTDISIRGTHEVWGRISGNY